jgi:xanthine dehydrogenase accessory factor
MNWGTTLARLQQQNQPAVMVTVVSITGSTPREAGAKMIITDQKLFGTIGGGNLEFQACAIARETLQTSHTQQLRRFPLGAGLGQCCGGLVNLLFEPIVESTAWVNEVQAMQLAGEDWLRAVATSEDLANEGQGCFVLNRHQLENRQPVNQQQSDLFRQAKAMLLGESSATALLASANEGSYYLELVKKPDFELLLFGAGHVGRAIVKVLSDMPLNIKWIDSRDDQFPADIPDNVETICTDTPEAEIDAAAAGSYFLVMTHAHGLDQHLAEHILQRPDFAYFGLIGSSTKRRMFEKRMAKRGLPVQSFNNMTCPIGIDGIRSKQPAAIAISVAAQIMQIREQKSDQNAVHNNNQPVSIGSAI